ncbi:ABC-three component system protein [Stenotrophomonas nitritireducens]|uniref:ABC-three component system protein n=1 Tax=Stenotrophomonas nitritireducens TaxID=83617 RepID=UPI003D9525A1
MLKRFRLERTGVYEKLVIANRVSRALDDFIEGRQSLIAMGAEQGGIPHWDDIVIEHSDGLFEHIQIKRQASDFDGTNTVSAPAIKTLSEFDKTIESLGSWARNPGTTPRKFVFTVPGLNTQIKKDYLVRQFEELCSVCRTTGATAEALAARNDGPTTNAYRWLTTWCGFDDWAHILSALKQLTIEPAGVESKLRDDALHLLNRHFTSGAAALAEIQTYVVTEMSDVSAVACRPLLKTLHHLARPELATWTQYQFENAMAGWNVSGTHDLVTDGVEAAPQVVEQLWKTCGATRKLRVSATCPQNDPNGNSLTSVILRLALHLQGSSQALLLEEAGWRARASQELGHTLGVGESDFDHLTWIENVNPPSQAAPRPIKGFAQADEEASQLTLAMDAVVWAQIVDKIEPRLAAIQDPDLRREMYQLWEAWRDELAQNVELRASLFARMMYAPGEKRIHAKALRVGPRSTDLLTDALETLLFVAVGLDVNNPSWQQFGTFGDVNVIALRRWSGPSDQAATVCELPSHGLTALLGADTSSIVILSGVEDSASEVLDVGLADDADATMSMATPRRPRMLVTRSSSTRQRLRNGNLTTVRAHFRQLWRATEDARDTAIRAYASGG